MAMDLSERDARIVSRAVLLSGQTPTEELRRAGVQSSVHVQGHGSAGERREDGGRLFEAGGPRQAADQTQGPERESSLLTTYWFGSTDLFGVPASRHGSLNPLFQVAVDLPS